MTQYLARYPPRCVMWQVLSVRMSGVSWFQVRTVKYCSSVPANFTAAPGPNVHRQIDWVTWTTDNKYGADTNLSLFL